MAGIAGRMFKVRKETIRAAGMRWEKQKQVREEGLRTISEQGPGAADTTKRRNEFTNRQAVKSISPFIVNERVIGSQDWMHFSPSERARKAADPVGRIVTFQKEHEPKGFGTGFLVTDSLLMTNHHVFPDRDFCSGSAVNFRNYCDERGTNTGIFFELDPDLFYITDEEYDFALVGIKATGTKGEKLSECGAIRLIEATGKILTGQPVNIIQHPNGGPRQYAVTNNRLVDILHDGFLHYETDTDRGSSGSPVFNEEWELVALHHSGVPKISAKGQILRKDGTVWDENNDDDDDIDWVANEGIRVSTLVKILKSKEINMSNPAEKTLLGQMLNNTADPLAASMTPPAPITVSPVDIPHQQSPGSASLMTTMNAFSIQGTVTINIQNVPSRPEAQTVVVPPEPQRAALPTLPPPTAPVAEQPAPTAQESALVFDEDYEKRSGYAEEFLGVTIKLPTVDMERRTTGKDGVGEIYLVQDYTKFAGSNRFVPKVRLLNNSTRNNPLVLHYHHYSLVMNKKYRMCMFTASNCDYRDLMRADQRKRSEFGSETWRADPRVPVEYQLVDKDIYRPARNVDRGHVHRREDNCWGGTSIQTEYANSDTYHWTNCTPQHELFNQENPAGYDDQKGIWGWFEGELEEQIHKSGGQAVLFAGPVLDEKYGVWQTLKNGTVFIPHKFWKVVVVPESTAKNARLLAYGFIFDQSAVIEKFGLDVKEALDLLEFERHKATIKEISDLSGVSFDKKVMSADQHLPKKETPNPGK